MLLPVKKHKSRGSLDDSMISAINVVFLLLVFFMIAGHIEARNTLLKVPQSSAQGELAEQAIQIKLIGDGQREINGNVIVGSLSAALGGMNIVAETVITLHIHRELPASALDPVLIAAREQGVKRLQIVTEYLP